MSHNCPTCGSPCSCEVTSCTHCSGPRSLRHVILRGAIDTASIRTSSFRGEDHIVVPVIIMVGDIVVRAMNSEVDEFVPAEELMAVPGGWDGRPVVPNHPENGTSSANKPHILESQSFGLLFNTRFEDNKLKADAWLSLSQAESVGDLARSVITRCEAREEVEVSAGVWIVSEATSGVAPNGDTYEAIWRDLVPDHFAMLPEGTVGACSVDAGCGAPRVAEGETKRSQPAQLRAAGEEETVEWKKRALAVLAMVRATPPVPDAAGEDLPDEDYRYQVCKLIRAAQDSMSDSELRDQLWSALQASRLVEPGFQFVIDVFPDENLVIYDTWTEPDGYRTWTQGYSSDDTSVTLSDDAQQVEQVVRYEPVTVEGAESEGEAEVKPTTAATSCTCNKGEERNMSNIKELVSKLVANKRSGFTEEDSDVLSTFTEERLVALVAHSAESKPDPKPKPDPVKPDPKPDPVEPTEEEQIAALPAGLQAMIRRDQTTQVEMRSALVKGIVTKTDVYNEEALKDMPVAALQTLSKALKVDEPVRSFQGSNPDPEADSDTVPPPPSLAAAIAKNRGEKPPEDKAVN